MASDVPVPAAPLPYAEAVARLTAAAAATGARRVPLGASREGRPLELVRFGSGARRVFWYGGPHANEVVGVATIVALAERLAARPPEPDTPTGVDVLLCVDPDSYVRNERWFAPEIDMGRYYRHFHRPPRDEWPDWDFPVEHRDLRRASRLPETAAMRAGLELSRPAAMVSLHNGELHGMHGYVRPGDRRLAAALAAVPALHGFPVESSPLDDPRPAPSLAPGVFDYPDMTAAWDAVLDSGADDPAALLPLGDSAAAWADARFGTTTVLVEVPHWSVDGALPVSGSLGELAATTAGRLESTADTVRAVLDRVPLPRTDLRVRASADAVGMVTGLAAVLRATATTPDGERAATSEDVGRLGVMLGECLPQRCRGQLLGALVDAGAPVGEIDALRSDFDDALSRLREVPIRTHPFPAMVQAQLAYGAIAAGSAVPA